MNNKIKFQKSNLVFFAKEKKKSFYHTLKIYLYMDEKQF